MKETKQQHHHLDDQGIIFLWGPVTDDSAETVCRQIIDANIGNRVRQIQLLINSAGGSCQAGFAIIDMMQWSRLPVYTAGFGLVGSMASLIFIAGQPGHRTVTPSTALLIHHFRSVSIGNYPDLMSARKYEDFLYQRVVNHIRCCSALKTEKAVLRHLLHDTDMWLTPAEAVRYGLADTIQDRLPKGDTPKGNNPKGNNPKDNNPKGDNPNGNA